MFETQQRDRDTSALAWTLFFIILIGAAVGGWFLATSLSQSQKQLTEVTENLKKAQAHAAVDRSNLDRCNQELNTTKTDLGTCNTNLEAAQAQVKQQGTKKHR